MELARRMPHRAVAGAQHWAHAERMMDVVFLGLAAILFGTTFGLIRLCDRV